ncbi:bone morphogenetic protein receptor type-2-like isoform 1-T23 [Odontesthes bonariensis]|uniref:bone morphogenetic protein receptor type-2-like n=1 Tax=Odontesthes bonariensis TaxID=219752 RepID=UPI003F588073
MASSALTMCVFVLLLPAVSGFQDGEERLCAFSSSLQGAEPEPTNELRGVVQENGTIRCSRGSRCYGLWERRADGEMQLLNQGCWMYQPQCHGERCVLAAAAPSQIQKANYRFCCCSRHLCNTNYTEAPPPADDPALSPVKREDLDNGQTDHRLMPKETALVALVTVAIVAILIMALFLGYRMMKRKQKHSLSAVDVMEAANTESAVDLENLKLLELIGRGRYGAVFRGSLNEHCVAVKVFSSANRQNFTNECSIYHLPLLQQHDNIARFLRSLTVDEKTAADGRSEFMILMEYYPHGCLSRYLSLHSVDWLTCCRMTRGVTRGLAFLHTELRRGDQYKPAVAHRDLTSRNVLVRADLSCVLADFGLSMKLTGTRPGRPGDDDTMAVSEVGTVRYMSPEVLGGALNLRDCESALKQVDVYALGLLFWESFRRCSDLFPDEAVPEYQLAFQEELGNHPGFEDMQNLVVREKHRPLFPEAWKENSLVLRSLKETMEDCWDQDAEARLTAQCAEERLAELTLLSTHTALHNHRNLSHSRWASPVGSGSSYIEDLQVGVVKNLQGDGHAASVVRMSTGGAEGAEKNRNSINYKRQQAQARSSTSDCNMLTSSTLTPASVLCTIPESQHTGGAVPGVAVCLQLTEEDLEATKLDPKEVDKNLRETSDENLMEHSQKQFSSEPQTDSRLYHQLLRSTEVNNMLLTAQRELGVVGGVDTPPSSIHPLPKQQNLPQRPTSLHLLPKTKETGSVCSRLKLGKLKSNHRQVETGVAKMNTVTAVATAERHLVTTVTNNANTRSSSTNRTEVHSVSSGVPTLVTNAMIGGGRTNPAGPQVEEEQGGTGGGAQAQGNLLNFSPDEHEPLLRREQLPAESEAPPPLHHHHHSRAGNASSGRSNSNNNNNRLALGSQVEVRGPEKNPCSGASQGGRVGCPKPEPEPEPAPVSDLDYKILGSSGKDLTLLAPPIAEAPLWVAAEVPQTEVPPTEVPQTEVPPTEVPPTEVPPTEVPPTEVPQTEVPPTEVPQTEVPQTEVPPTEVPPTEVPSAPVPQNSQESDPDLKCSRVQTSETPTLAQNPAAPAAPPGAADRSASEPAGPQNPWAQLRPTKARRPERPCSLDLSSSCISSDDVSLTDGGSLSATGEKIKRRVKTPYTLKKWRPASWVVSTDTALDPDFEFNTRSSGQTPKINQSKSSMAVFLVGGGATATTTSDPDGMSCF